MAAGGKRSDEMAICAKVDLRTCVLVVRVAIRVRSESDGMAAGSFGGGVG